MSTLDTKKSVGLDAIPSKLVKMAASVLRQKIILHRKAFFPDNTKIAMVSPLDNGTAAKIFGQTVFRVLENMKKLLKN